MLSASILEPLRGSKPGDLHTVLQGERHSVQGPELIAAGNCGVGLLGQGQGVWRERHDGVEGRVEGRNAVKVRLHDLLRRERLVPNALGQLRR